jgi:hypothetical protein
MKVVTVATHPDRYFNSLLDSAKKNNIEITVLGMGEKWQGFKWKLTLMKEFLKNNNPYEIVVFIDAYDVIFLQDLNKLKEVMLYYKGLKNSVSSLGRTEFIDNIIYKYDEGYPVLSIEMGEQLFINYQRTMCYYDEYKETEDIDIISQIGRIFKYKNINVYFNYKNFTEFKNNYKDSKEYLLTKLYCSTIYDYYKKGKGIDNKYYKYEYGFWKLDSIGKIKVSIDIVNKVNKEIGEIKWKDFILEELHFVHFFSL